MVEILGDIRRNPEASIALAQTSLHTLGYVVASDSDQIGLDPRFRSDVLPEYTAFLQEDIYPIPPLGRLRADGLAEYVKVSDGSIRLTHDHEQVAMPIWSGNGFTEPRIYPNGLPIMDHPIARTWLEGVVTLALLELPNSEGSIAVHYYETGHNGGKVVEGKHQDGELVVVSFPDLIIGGGAETSLHRRIDPLEDSGEPKFDRAAAFTLGVGDIALSNDVDLWHDVSVLTSPPDGTEPRRRSLIVNVHAPRTHQWLQDFYAGSPHRLRSSD
jgi:hypothetical protein